MNLCDLCYCQSATPWVYPCIPTVLRLRHSRARAAYILPSNYDQAFQPIGIGTERQAIYICLFLPIPTWFGTKNDNHNPASTISTREPASAYAEEKKVMSVDINITDGVITYDVSKAESAVAALITARFAESADLIVAGVQTLAVMKGINPQIKIDAVTLAAQNWQAILDAVYAGHPLPTPGNVVKTKPRVTHETSDMEPKEAPVNPALQELANLLFDGDVDQTLTELLDVFASFAELTPEQREARYSVARQVLSGELEVDDKGVLTLARELADLRRKLQKAEAEKAAADGRVTTARTEGKREGERNVDTKVAAAKREAEKDVDARIAAAKAQAKADAERDIAARLAAAKQEGAREAGRSTDAQLASARTEAVNEYRRAHGLSDEWLTVIDQVMSLDDESIRNARFEGIQAVADGTVSVQYVRETIMPAVNNLAQILKYGEGGVTNMGTNRVFQALDRPTQELLQSRRPRRRS